MSSKPKTGFRYIFNRGFYDLNVIFKNDPDGQPYFEHKSSIKQSARTVFRVDTPVGTKYNLYKDTQVICMFEMVSSL